MIDRAMIFAREAFIVDLQIALNQEMRKAGVSRSELADRLGRSKGVISQFFDSGDVTPGTVAEMAFALGLELKMQLVPIEKGIDQ